MGKQSQRTQGTWAVVHDKGEDYTVCAFDGDPRDGIMAEVICEVTSIQDEADAHLLAAAADLLVALTALVRAVEADHDAQGIDPRNVMAAHTYVALAMREADAAITKAGAS